MLAHEAAVSQYHIIGNIPLPQPMWDNLIDRSYLKMGDNRICIAQKHIFFRSSYRENIISNAKKAMYDIVNIESKTLKSSQVKPSKNETNYSLNTKTLTIRNREKWYRIIEIKTHISNVKAEILNCRARSADIRFISEPTFWFSLSWMSVRKKNSKPL